MPTQNTLYTTRLIALAERCIGCSEVKPMPGCEQRLDGVWQQSTTVTLDRIKDPGDWQAAKGNLSVLANGNYTTARLLAVRASPVSENALMVMDGLDAGASQVYQSTDKVSLHEVFEGGKRKTYRRTQGNGLGPTLTIEMSRTGRVLLRVGNQDFRRPALNGFGDGNNGEALKQLMASYRGYDITTQDPLFLADNRMSPVFSTGQDSRQIDGKQVPIGLDYQTIGVQGTVYRKSLATSASDIQSTESISFGMNASAGLGPVEASYGFEAANETSQRMRQSGTVGSAIGYARDKRYALVLDLPHAELAPDFIDAVCRLKSDGSPGEYQRFIRTFGTHYPYAVTYGATAKTTWALSEQEYMHEQSRKASFSQEAGIDAFGANGEIKMSATRSGSRGESAKQGKENATFIAVGGNGAWNESNYSAGDNPYPILLDLRPLHQLINPVTFPGLPELYGTVRLRLKAAIRDYMVAQTHKLDRASLLPSIQWFSATNGSVPKAAIRGGQERNGTPLYVCVAPHQGGLHPGKVTPNLQGCMIGYSGKEVKVPRYRVATGQGQWIAASNGNRPRNAVPYGYEKDGNPLYVCRASINNGVHPGKLLKRGKCAVGHGGAEKYFDRYEVLVSVVRQAKTAADRVRDSMFVPAK